MREAALLMICAPLALAQQNMTCGAESTARDALGITAAALLVLLIITCCCARYRQREPSIDYSALPDPTDRTFDLEKVKVPVFSGASLRLAAWALEIPVLGPFAVQLLIRVLLGQHSVTMADTFRRSSACASV